MLHTRLTMKKIWKNASASAAYDIGTLSDSVPCACVYSVPPSQSRRFTPASPCTNIGKKITFMQMIEPTK